MDEQRRDISIAQVSPNLRNAVIAVEDHRFRYHPGIDPLGFSRAVVENLRAGGVAEGGSTDHPTAGADAVLVERTDLGPEGAGGSSGTHARDAAHQGGDSRAVSESRLPRGGDLRRREDVAAPVRQTRARSHHCGKRAHRRADSAPVGLFAMVEHERRPRTEPRRAPAHARGGLHHGGRREGARAARLPIRPYPRSDRTDNGYAKQYVRQQFRSAFGGDHPPDWKVFTTFNAIAASGSGACRHSRPGAPGPQRFAGGDRRPAP